jgi:hypothetical protein
LIKKTLTVRFELYAKNFIHPTQNAFMKGRDIMSNVMSLHEILHEAKRKKQLGIIFKLDFEEAYDKVN